MDISDALNQITGSATAQIFSKARELEAAGKDIVHLEIGQPDFSPPDPVIQATIDALKSGKTTYTVSRGIEELRQAIVGLHKAENGVDLDYRREVIVTAGAKLGIFGSVWSVTNPGDNVVILNPSWVSYGDMVSSLGAEPRFLTVDMSFNFDRNELSDLVDKDTSALIVNSPSNPTGAIISNDKLKYLLNFCRNHNILLISDEMYNDFIYEGTHNTVLELDDWKETAVVINGFSKTFSMTGYRLGYVLGQQQIIDQVNKVMQLTTTCAVNFAQHAALAAIDHLSDMRAFISETMGRRRELVVDMLTEIGVKFEAPKGGIYVWFKIPTNDSTQWASELLEQTGVATTPGRAFGPDGEGYIRLCFATNIETLREGIRRIGNYLRS